MRHHTTAALVLTALTLTACSADPSGTVPTASSSPRGGSDAAVAKPLSSAALSTRLLTEKDLGEGYVRTAEHTQHNDDVAVIGCPALAKLGGDAATGQSLDFPNKAKAAFIYSGGSDSEVAEELYSDSAQKLSDGVGRIFEAMASCPKYQVVSGSTAIDMTTQATSAPQLGEERWSQLLTYSTGGQRSIVKQTAIRNGNVLVIVSGSPGLVDAHLDKACAKAAV
ncbi:hypothetical protein GCM10010211_20430 [Streptomyces albospinus]|uniref:Secreted protein n=1 Tax=Streptomyces albospinus TaxID=285515 RepID=A0ABQ2UW42_9ACTN|nr:hypothetical protein [Streptomyces albospinus]GGU55579.1 hypothetical protein GCM10010211_20430 [Streptomyces albospinus]